MALGAAGRRAFFLDKCSAHCITAMQNIWSIFVSPTAHGRPHLLLNETVKVFDYETAIRIEGRKSDAEKKCSSYFTWIHISSDVKLGQLFPSVPLCPDDYKGPQIYYDGAGPGALKVSKVSSDGQKIKVWLAYEDSGAQYLYPIKIARVSKDAI